MSDDNKHNIMFFESPSVRGLYDTMHEWQNTNRKRLLSLNVQKDGDMFCCIALTNPMEVVITDFDGSRNVFVTEDGALWVDGKGI